MCSRLSLTFMALLGLAAAGCQASRSPAAHEPAAEPEAPTVPTVVVASAHLGQKVFADTCQVCHQANGKGLPFSIPPLAGSDYLMADKERAIRVISAGLAGTVKVNGKTYNSVMPPQATLSNAEIASVLTYVRGSFGNPGGPVSVEEVAQVRAHVGVAKK